MDSTSNKDTAELIGHFSNRLSIDPYLRLYHAINEGNIGNAEQILDRRKLDVNAHVVGLAPIHIAVARGDEAMINLLMLHGANVNTQTQEGLTPLHIAAIHGYTDIFIDLYRKPETDRYIRDHSDRTPFDYLDYSPDTIEALIQQKLIDNKNRESIQNAVANLYGRHNITKEEYDYFKESLAK